MSTTETTLRIRAGNLTHHVQANVNDSIDTAEILWRYNDEKAVLYIPVITYMIILTIVGTTGNILVCYIYGSKRKKTSSHFFILTLAVLDLLTCIIGMPTEVADLRYPYMFYASAACKLLRFVESITNTGSSIILIAVAVDRYLRICKLGRRVSLKAAKILCLSAVGGGIFISWPACLLFGRQTVALEHNITGIDCSTEDGVKNTVYPIVYYGFLFILFIGSTVFFTVMYCSIGAQLWKQKTMKMGEKTDRSSSSCNKVYASSSSTKNTDGTGPRSSDPISTQISSEITDENSSRKYSKERRATYVSQSGVKNGKKQQIKIQRTTVVLFAVTVAYIISYLPFLVVMVLRSIKTDFMAKLSPTEEVIYKFCVKSYFINNAINPLIYSFLNMNFRKDVRSVINRVCATCCWCRRSEI
ncbi:hypothetical protein ACJMK2_004459 [Sinanodonta woodiana]|uniref:G-protein coupled receptors family 1 profile domain-containing protein n=1 Tax=Sinanodonta woodiana TaxID=1069815 RepID=A0ABD3Y2K0_SINWO